MGQHASDIGSYWYIDNLGCVQKRILGEVFLRGRSWQKEIEFLELKQGNMIVVEYAAKFEALMKFSPHYNRLDAETSKSIKFKNGMTIYKTRYWIPPDL